MMGGTEPRLAHRNSDTPIKPGYTLAGKLGTGTKGNMHIT